MPAPVRIGHGLPMQIGLWTTAFAKRLLYKDKYRAKNGFASASDAMSDRRISLSSHPQMRPLRIHKNGRAGSFRHRQSSPSEPIWVLCLPANRTAIRQSGPSKQMTACARSIFDVPACGASDSHSRAPPFRNRFTNRRTSRSELFMLSPASTFANFPSPPVVNTNPPMHFILLVMMPFPDRLPSFV